METKTRGEYISQIKNAFRLVNADARITDRFVWSIIDKHFRWIIKRESKKFYILRGDFLFQTLKCTRVEAAPAIDDCCGIVSKCKVYRTEEKLPKLYEDGSGVVIKSVYGIDGSIDFIPISIEDYRRKLEDPNSKYDNNYYYYYNNGYLYFPKKHIRKVMVKGYFEDDIAGLNCDDSLVDTCRSAQDEPIRIPDYLLGEIMQFVIKDLTIIFQVKNDDQIDKNSLRMGQN